MLTDGQSRELAGLRDRIAELDAEQSRLARQAWDLIKPNLGTLAECRAMLDLAPPGFARFRVHERIYQLEEGRGESGDRAGEAPPPP
jgi:hypothetical protein